MAGYRTDPKVIYNIRSRKAFKSRWLADRGEMGTQYWKTGRKGAINMRGGPLLDVMLRKKPDYEAVPVPMEWRVDYIPFNSRTDERIVKWFRTEADARRFYKRLLKQQYPPKSQGIMEAQRPL